MDEEPHVRDLLGHLCAEIERQQAQIGEQGEEIAELAEDNRRLRFELEQARLALSSTAAYVRESSDAACQTVAEELGGSWDTLQQPEPAPEPPQLPAASTGSAGQLGRGGQNARLRSETAEGQESFVAASIGATGDGSHGTSAEDKSSLNACSMMAVDGDRNPAAALVAAGQPAGPDEEGPPWSLSPTSLASNASSPMWLGSACESFSSEGSPPHAGEGRKKLPSSESAGDQPTNWPGLRRHPPEAALVSAAGGLAPRRLVRSVLDALDTAQRRLQQNTARSKAKRAAAAAAARASGGAAGGNSQGSSQVQVDIRIYLPGAAQDEHSEDRARAKEDCDVAAGSFMYILL